MALINMKCDNCGAPLKAEGSAYVCDYCRAVYARIADPDACLTGSVTIEEFKQELEKSARTFSVSFDDAASDSYTDNELSRDRLRLAGELLRTGRGYRVAEVLKEIPDGLFKAQKERLLLLSEAGAADETELSFLAKDIKKLKHYDSFMSVCNESTKSTYEYISGICLQNLELEKKINNVRSLMAEGLAQKGEGYAKEIVARHPYKAKAWELLIEARCLNDPGYTPSEDLEYLLACRDAEMTVTGKNADRSEILRNISPVIAERIRRSDREKGKRNAVIWSLIIRPAAVVIALAAIILIWKFIGSVF